MIIQIEQHTLMSGCMSSRLEVMTWLPPDNTDSILCVILCELLKQITRNNLLVSLQRRNRSNHHRTQRAVPLNSPAVRPWWCGSCALTRWWSWRTGSWGCTRPACSPGRCWWASWPADPSLPEDSRLEGWGAYCIRSPRARLRKQHKTHKMGNGPVKSNIGNSSTNKRDRISCQRICLQREITE